VICAGAPAAKWIANKDPDADRRNLDSLMSNLAGVSAERFVLISTIDVYPEPRGVDEDAAIDPKLSEPYGRNRFALEQFVRATFPASLIFRLPALFGKGLKKNFIFDIINNQESLHLTHQESRFQFYEMGRLSKDLDAALASSLQVLNITAEPVSAQDVALHCADLEFRNETDKPPVSYDVRTKYSSLLNASGPYHFSAEETFRALRAYIHSERQSK
jgi:nucleoside-diphosphate-sugar epimerase